MRTVLLASVRTYLRRYVAGVLAVAAGVAFVVITNGLASAARDGLVSGVDLPYRNADLVVSDLDGSEAATVVERARRHHDAAAVLGWTMQPVSGSGLVSRRTDVGVMADAPSLRWQRVEQGRFPRTAGEAVVDVNAAKTLGLEVGDRIRVGAGARAAEVVVVGAVDSPSASVGASLYLPWQTVARWASGLYVDSVAYAARGTTQGTEAGLAAALRADSGGTVRTADAFVEHRTVELSQGVDIVGYVLLLFAAIAFFVAVLVVTNTFAILFAQRGRDFALLRCVGSTRGQLLRAIRLEALALGLASSLLGLATGAGLGLGAVAVVRAVVPQARLGSVSYSPAWFLAALVVGTGVTLVASWLPTRRVVLVGPLAALRPEGAAATTPSGRRRVLAGLVLAALGTMLLGLAVATSAAPVLVMGGAVSFTGVLLLGPVLVPALVRAFGRAGRRLAGRSLGSSLDLAAGNAVRNPRRTATTTASLVVGVTLTTAVLTGVASARQSVDREMDEQYPVDVALVAGTSGFGDTVLADVRKTRQVAAAAAIPGVLTEVSGGVGTLDVLVAPRTTDVVRAALPRPRPGEIVLPDDAAGDRHRVRVTVGDRSVVLRVRRGEGFGTVGLVAPRTLARLGGAEGIRAVWVRAAGGADAEDLTGDLGAIVTPYQADVESGLQNRAFVDRQLTVLTSAVVGLLAVAVVIALVGIGNTLGLSVLERGREHALLRALGLTRRGLRTTLAFEAVLLSLVATVVGVLLGVGYAWVGTETLVAPVAGGGVRVPWDQLLATVVVAGLAGLAACVLPARKAVRVSPGAGLAMD
ncbi:MAG: ABC transporter permease [Nocardioidaceae bacterium]|nr:ABC transporter permease [Nocardioidaceae bacterium]